MSGHECAVGTPRSMVIRRPRRGALDGLLARSVNLQIHHSMTTTVFKSQRLIAKRWIPEDFDALLAVYSDREAMRWVGDGEPITRDECHAWFRVTECNYAKRGYGMFTLVEAEGGAVAGFAGLVHPGGQLEPELKYAFLRTHWGAGLATEAARQLLDYGAWVHGLRRIIATVAPGNLASQRVLAKAGMALAEERLNRDGTKTLVFEWMA